MKTIVNALKNFAGKNWRMLATALLFIVALFVTYRTEFLALYNRLYPGALEVGSQGYLLKSFGSDCKALLVFAGLLLPFLFISRRFSRIRHSFLAVLLIVCVFLLFAGLGHFQIFEIPLDMNMIGSGLDTFWQEILNSATYEISPELMNTLILLVVSSLLFAVTRYFAEKFRDQGLGTTRLSRILRRIPAIASWLLPLILIGLSAEKAAAIDAKLQSDSLQGRSAKYSRAEIPSLNKIAENPVATVLLHPFAGQEPAGSALKTRPSALTNTEKFSSRDFSWGMNTDSLVTRKRYPRVPVRRNKKYNIILYFMESTCQHYVSTNVKGHSVTPAFDRLRKNSFVAKNHYGSYPLSVNAMYSIFSSAYDHSSKLVVSMAYPGVRIRSLPEKLKEAGYTTAAVQSSTMTIFDHHRYFRYRKFDRLIDLEYFENRGHKKVTPLSVNDLAMIKPAVEFMQESQKEEKPFFVSMFPFMPHHPYVFEGMTNAIYSQKEINEEKVFKNKSFMRYLNALHYADDCLGQFIQALHDADLMENTLVFVFADHGEAFYQHRWNVMHPFKIYEENIRLPFLVYSPEMFKETYEYEGISRHVDIMPTILDLVGLPLDKEYEGLSLFSAHKQQLAYLHTYWARNYCGVRDGRWKYIRCMKTGYQELYDLSADTWEQKNLAREKPELSRQFREYVLSAVQYKQEYYRRIFQRGGSWGVDQHMSPDAIQRQQKTLQDRIQTIDNPDNLDNQDNPDNPDKKAQEQ